MALKTLRTNIVLDVYDHDGKKPEVKSIALDDNTRYVFANITDSGNNYDIGQDSTVTLIVVRPDKVGVEVAGQPEEIVLGVEDEQPIVIYGAYAELNQPAIAVKGTLLGQFIITNGNQRLTSQIFTVNNGRSLATETSEWTDEYQGYDLEEFAERIETVETTVTNVCKIVATGTTLAITTTKEA